jgi:hypothetical protein
MQKRRGLTLTDVLVLIVLSLIILAVYLPVSQASHQGYLGPRCATNLKQLGTAMIIYANDYEDDFPVLDGKGPWSKRLGFDYYLQDPDFEEGGAEEYNSRTISGSLYMLIREADVFPKTFVCPESEQAPFDGYNDKGLDIVELWDLGYDPYKHVSYSYQNPYGRYAADGTLSASFAIAGDMSPWFYFGDIVPPGEEYTPPQIIDITDPSTWLFGNSINHKPAGLTCGEYQNVLYGDSHVSYAESPNVGINYDNIYTFWSTTEYPTEQDIQGGVNPTSRGVENYSQTSYDSFLAI